LPHLNITLRLNEIVQKADEAPRDCQDAYDYNTELNRYAIADGVSQSFFPAEWAKLLVQHFCNDPSPLNADLFHTKKWREWLAPVQLKWFEEIKRKVTQKRGHSGTHLRNSLAQRDPAAATFVGVQIDTSLAGGEARWHSMIIGDSCLFHIRGGQLNSYPINDPTDFDYHPEHFASNGDLSKFEPRFVSGTIRDGDVLILTTDALAKWILTRNGAGEQARRDTLARLLELRRWSDLYRFVEEARRQGETPLDDDDVALLILSASEKNGAGVVKIPTHTPKPDRTRTVGEVVAPRSRPVIPQHTSPKTLEEEDVRTVRPQLRRESWMSLLALCLSVVGVVISMVTAYRQETLVTRPVAPVATPAPSPAASEIKPATTQVATDITLPKDTSISKAPGPQGVKLLTIQNSTPAKTVSDSSAEQGWTKVQVDIWVSAGRQFTSASADNITINVAMNARKSADSKGGLVGRLAPGTVFKKVGEATVTPNNKWYQVRVEGFIPQIETAPGASPN
jgi:hypothetical protein